MKKTRKKNKYTLTERLDRFETRMNKMDSTLSQIGKVLVELKQDVKNINTRLDYIVKANDLKDISNR